MGRTARVWTVCWLVLGLAPLASTSARAEETLELRLASDPHAPGAAPDVVVHVPARLDPAKPVHWLVFLHGFSSCAHALVAADPAFCQRGVRAPHGYGLGKLHERAHTNTLLIVPQLAYLTRDARAPRFEQSGGFSAFVIEVRDQLAQKLGQSLAPASISLLAHSAGYRAAAAILGDPSTPKQLLNLVLFDALYAHWDVFARWLLAAKERRILSFHTADRSTTLGNRKLEALVGRGGQLRIVRVDTPHRAVPERHLAEVLAALFDAR